MISFMLCRALPMLYMLLYICFFKAEFVTRMCIFQFICLDKCWKQTCPIPIWACYILNYFELHFISWSNIYMFQTLPTRNSEAIITILHDSSSICQSNITWLQNSDWLPKSLTAECRNRHGSSDLEGFQLGFPTMFALNQTKNLTISHLENS